MEFNISTRNRFALFEDEQESAVVEEPTKPVKKPGAGKGKGDVKNVKPGAKKVVTAPKQLIAQPQQQQPPNSQFVNRTVSSPKPPQQRYEKPDLGKKRGPQKPAQFNKHKSIAPVEVETFGDEFPGSPVGGDVSKKEGDEPTQKESAEVGETKSEKPPPVPEKRSYAEYKASLKKVEDNFNVRKAGEGADLKIFKKLVPITRNKTFLPDAKEPEPEERVKTNRKARETKVELPPGELFQLPRRGRNRRDGDNERRSLNLDKAHDGGADPSAVHNTGGRPRGGGGFRGGRGGGPRRSGDLGRFHGGDRGGAERGDRSSPRGEGAGGNFRGGGGGGGNYRGGRGNFRGGGSTGGGNFRGGRAGGGSSGSPLSVCDSLGGSALSSLQQQAVAAVVVEW